MNKKTGLITLGVAAIATYGILKVKSLAETPKALQIKLLSLKINYPKIFLSLQIFNPTNNQIKIDSIVGEVFFNNKSIGNIQYVNTVPILPNTYSTFNNVLVELTPSGTFTLTTEILTRSAKTGTFLISGKMFLKGQGIPFSQSINVF